MGVLETVFNSRKFDLNDDVLMEFNNYSLKMVDYLKKALIYGHTSRISS